MQRSQVGRQLFQSDAILHFLAQGGAGANEGVASAQGESPRGLHSLFRSPRGQRGAEVGGVDVMSEGKLPKVQDSMVSKLKKQRDALASEV